MTELDELKTIVRDLGMKLCDRIDELEVELDTLREENKFGVRFAKRVQSDMDEILAGRRPAPIRIHKRAKRSDDWALVALHGLLSERLGAS